MKKILIASTALVAASLIHTGAAQASDKIKLELGGYSKWWVVGATQQSAFKGAQAAGTGQYSAVDIKGDNEVFIGGETTLNNGIKVGINIELEAGGNVETRNSTSTDVIDKSVVFVEGGFGKVLIGTEANGTALLHVMAPDAAGNWASDGILTGQFAIAAPARFAANGAAATTTGAGFLGVRTTTEIDTDDNSEKITYVSPSFYGLTVGGSYIPNALTEDNRGVDTTAIPAYGVGALYANTFGAVGVKVSGGYVTYDLTRAAGAGTANEHTDRNIEWSAGAQLSYAGFTLGGSYRDIKDNVGASAVTSSEGNVWDAGLQYASGPYAVSFAYLRSTAEGLVATSKDLKEEVYQISGKYSLGAGVDALASAGYQKYTGETSAAAENNKGYSVMTGLSLAF